jgi:hypothetical protein
MQTNKRTIRGKPGEKRQLERPGGTIEDNIKMFLRLDLSG